METSVTLKVEDLDASIIQAIRQLFKKEREVTLRVSSATDFELNALESGEQYIARLQRAIQNLDEGRHVIFSEEELDNFAFQRLKR